MSLNVQKDSFKFAYKLSDACLNRHFLETGNKLNASQVFEVPGSILSVDARRAIAEGVLVKTGYSSADYKLLLEQDQPLTEENINAALAREVAEAPNRAAKARELLQAVIDEKQELAENITVAGERIRVPAVPSSWDIKRIAESAGLNESDRSFVTPEQQQWLDNRNADRDRAKAEAEQQAKAVQAKREQEQADREVQAEAAKAKADAERAEWIQEHGSEHLKLALKHGYNMQRKYAEERAALEYPEFELDFDDEAEWKGRSSPSMEALILLDALKETLPDGAHSMVVWITKRHDFDPEECDYPDDQTEEEAVVIRGYLGRYDLIRYLGDPQA